VNFYKTTRGIIHNKMCLYSLPWEPEISPTIPMFERSDPTA
jgi:hypothetical protein